MLKKVEAFPSTNAEHVVICEDETGKPLSIAQGGSKKAHGDIVGSKDISSEMSELPTFPTKWLLRSSAGVLAAILNKIIGRVLGEDVRWFSIVRSFTSDSVHSRYP